MNQQNPRPTVRHNPPFLLAAGEALVDLITHDGTLYEACLGGSVFNFCRALSFQGGDVTYLNPLSTDPFGQQFHRALVDAGVRVAAPPSSHPSALALVNLAQKDQPTYTFHRAQVADRDTSPEALCQLSVQALTAPAALGSAHWAYTGCLALVPQDAPMYQRWLKELRHLGCQTVVDINIRPAIARDSNAYRHSVLQTLQQADWIKASDEDLEWLVGRRAPMDSVNFLFDHSPAHVVALTEGSKGASLYLRGQNARLFEPAPRVCVLDTVGAGDCFIAGLIARLWFELQTPIEPQTASVIDTFLSDEALQRRVLRHAVQTAAINVTRRGCVPPSWDEVVENF